MSNNLDFYVFIQVLIWIFKIWFRSTCYDWRNWDIMSLMFTFMLGWNKCKYYLASACIHLLNIKHILNSLILLHFYFRVQVPLKYPCEILLWISREILKLWLHILYKPCVIRPFCWCWKFEKRKSNCSKYVWYLTNVYMQTPSNTYIYSTQA
jgi:hypothetical protein